MRVIAEEKYVQSAHIKKHQVVEEEVKKPLSPPPKAPSLAQRKTPSPQPKKVKTPEKSNKKVTPPKKAPKKRPLDKFSKSLIE